MSTDCQPACLPALFLGAHVPIDKDFRYHVLDMLVEMIGSTEREHRLQNHRRMTLQNKVGSLSAIEWKMGRRGRLTVLRVQRRDRGWIGLPSSLSSNDLVRPIKNLTDLLLRHIMGFYHGNFFNIRRLFLSDSIIDTSLSCEDALADTLAHNNLSITGCHFLVRRYIISRFSSSIDPFSINRWGI